MTHSNKDFYCSLSSTDIQQLNDDIDDDIFLFLSLCDTNHLNRQQDISSLNPIYFCSCCNTFLEAPEQFFSTPLPICAQAVAVVAWVLVETSAGTP